MRNLHWAEERSASSMSKFENDLIAETELGFSIMFLFQVKADTNVKDRLSRHDVAYSPYLTNR